MYVRGGESFSSQVRDPITVVAVTCRDKAAPLIFEEMKFKKGVVVAIAVTGEVWGI